MQARQATRSFRWIASAILFLFIFSPCASGQKQELHFDSVEEIDAPYVASIVQDKRGFMWFGTNLGLFRYDGIRAHYLPLTDESSEIKNVWSIIADRRGSLWICMQEFLIELDPISEKVLRRLDSNALGFDQVKLPNFLCACEDSQGNIWIGTESSGLIKVDSQHGTTKQFTASASAPHGLQPGRIQTICRGKGDTIWIGHYGGLSTIDTETDEFKHYLTPQDSGPFPRSFIRKLLQDETGRIWVGLIDGLGIYDKDSDAIRRIEGSTDVYGLAMDQFNRLWVMQYDGYVRIIDPETEKTISVVYGESQYRDRLPATQLDTIYSDRSGTIWIGTFGAGAFRHHPRTARVRRLFHRPDSPETLRAGQTTNLHRDVSGTIWVGGTYGISRFDEQSFEFEHIDLPAASLPIRGITSNEDGLWIRSKSEVHLIQDGNVRESLGIANGLDLDYSRTDRGICYTDGVLWVAGDGAVFEYHSDSKTFTRRLDSDQGLPKLASPFWIDSDSTGAFWSSWACDHPSTSYFVRFNSNQDSFELYDRPPYQVVMDIEQHQGTTWGLSATQLIRVNSKASEIARERNLNESAHNSMLSDDLGMLWIGTSNGLMRYDPAKDEVDYKRNTIGFLPNSYIAGAAEKLQNGSMMFAGESGIDIVNPRHVETAAPPTIAITSVHSAHVANEHYPTNGKIELLHSQNSIVAEFAALDFAAPEKNRYDVWLEGEDPSWRSVGNTGVATYIGLSPADYRLKIRATNSAGVQSIQPAVWEFTVKPAFWQTYWFYSLVSCSLLLVAFTIHMHRLAALKGEVALRRTAEKQLHAEIEHHLQTAEERERLAEQLRNSQRLESLGRMAGGIAHDLNNIHGAIRLNAESAIFMSPSEVSESLNEIMSAVDRATQFTQKILAFGRGLPMKSEVVDLNGAIEESATLVKRLLRKGAELQLNLSSHPIYVEIDPTQLQQVIMNLLVNAGDAMPGGGTIVVTTLAETGQAVVSVKDNGNGIPENQIGRIFDPFFTTKPVGKGTGLGLAAVHGIISQSGGDIQVESSVGQGTTFHLNFPTVPAPTTINALTTRNADKGKSKPGGPCVLVCDDDNAVRRILVACLRKHGFRVEEADSTAAAAVIARRLGDQLDLLLTDVVMPHGTGPELVQELRSLAPDLPVLYATGYSQETTSLHLDEKTGLVLKPFRIAKLIAEAESLTKPADK